MIRLVCAYIVFHFDLIGSAVGITTRMQLLKKFYCTPNLKVVGSDGNFVACGISDVTGTEGLTLPGMEDGVHITREDIILVDDGMAKKTRIFGGIFGGIATIFNEGAMDFNSDGGSKGSSLRVLSKLTEHGFTDTGHTELDGVPVRVLTGNAINIKGAESLDNFAKEGLAANHFTLYMDEKVDGKVLKMEARNTYAENELLEEVFITAHQTLSENMDIDGALDELQRVYGGTICKSSAQSLQSQFAKAAAANEEATSPSSLHERHLSEADRQIYKKYEGRWDELDWLKVKEEHRSLRRRAAIDNSGFKPIEYFTIEPNSAAEAFFRHKPDLRKLFAITVTAPQGCDLEKKTFDDIFCAHALLDNKDGNDVTDVTATLYDHYNPNTTRISAGISLVQKDGEAIGLHISGGGSAVVYSTDGEVKLEAKAKLELIDGGNSRNYPNQQPSIGCGYILSGEVSLKAEKTNLLTAGFGGTGVVGGGKDNLLGTYLPLKGGLDALVAGFLLDGLFFATSQGSLLVYTLNLPITYGIWAPFYKHSGVLQIFDNREVRLLELI